MNAQNINLTGNKYILPHGVTASLQRVDPSAHANDGAAMNGIHRLLDHEARVLGTTVSPEGFKKLYTAIESNQLQVYALDVSYPHSWPERVGAIIVLPTVYTHWDTNEKAFKTDHAIYVEDTAVDPDASAKFRKETVIEDLRPNGTGLGEFMNCELFRVSAAANPTGLLWGASSSAYVAECGERSYAMHKIYTNLFGRKTEESGLYVMQFSGKPEYERNIRTTVNIEDLGYTTTIKTHDDKEMVGKVMPEHVFSTKWRNGSQLEQVQIDTTHSLSTFQGRDVFRVVINHSERVPDIDKLVTIYGDMFQTVANEILENKIKSSGIGIEDVYNMMYVHVQDTKDLQMNQRCMEAMRRLGMKQRKLGTCFMRPVVLPYNQLSDDVFYHGKQAPTPYCGYLRSQNGVVRFSGHKQKSRRPVPKVSTKTILGGGSAILVPTGT